ncbi:hypothetical protein CYMTET_5161 [Cymbomonas tetramitiformis]|uniref:Uncharacterized protein n=1 Tax=Cymbomonas tetramitiformis TaxID=36881 RepID=A0AAE0LJQ9_9CHLO|nr:hypothetical protein CYMTET_5161 [Cymbomonas tetramitiformis]
MQVFQAAVDGGAAAFAAAVEQHGAPAVVSAGAASGGVDISAYGFTTVASGASGEDEMDVHEELRDLRHQIEEFPGGVELIPVRYYVPTMPIDPPVSAVACSFPPEAASFVEPGERSQAPIDDLFSDTDEEAGDSGMAAAAPGGDLASEHGGVTTWDVP